MGRMHGTVYGTLDGANLVAACDVVLENAEKIAAPHGARATTSFDDLLNDPSIDVIDCCLPTYMHADISIRAMEAGKHVLCEKPMALTVADADRMIATSEATGKRLMIAHCIRFWPEYVVVRDLVKSGRLGRLLSINMTRYGAFPSWSWENWLSREDLAGGGALDMHIHDTDFANYILGTPQSQTSIGTIDERGPSHIFTTLHYPGTVIHLEGGWNLPPATPFKMAFRAIFEQGAAIMDGGPLSLYTADGGSETPEIAKMSTSGGGNISDLGGYFYEMKYFYDCLASGAPFTECTVESTRESLRMVLSEIDMVKSAVAVKA